MAQGFRDTRFLRGLYINAHRAPTIHDDDTVGVAVGVRWIDESGLVEYICQDSTTGAAVWFAPAGSGGGGGGLSWHGDWDSGAAYTANNLVTYGGGTYISLISNTNVVPDTLAPNWAALSSPGVTVDYADGHYRTKSSFIHTQGVASATWNIHHALGTYPAVTVEDSTGDVVDAGVHYVDADNILVTAAFAFSGQAFLT